MFNFTVLYNNEPGKFTFYYKGVRLNINNANVTFVPNSGMTAGEIKTLASQMPGSQTDHVWMIDTNIWYNGAWRPFNGTRFPIPSPYFGNIGLSQWDIGIWDKYCYS